MTSPPSHPTHSHDADGYYEYHDHDDAAHLNALGYKSEFKRDMSPWANFSLGFTYLSPVVGIYSMFALSMMAGGPPMIWSLLIVGVGQLLVALVFSEIVAQFPVAGGVYPWARRLWGRRWAWMTGWVYLVALLVTIAAVAYGGGPFVAGVFGWELTTNTWILCSLAILAIATVLNFMGTKVLAQAAIVGFTAEILGALAVGGWLLLSHREQNLSVLFDGFGTAGDGSYFPAFAAAALIGLFQYYGFEACGDVAEEVPDPGRLIPKAMRRTIYIGGAAATFICMALILAIADIPAVIAGEDPDPVGTLLVDAFGATGSKIVFIVVLMSFVSCAMSLQAAASRLAYAYGRDDMIIGSSLLKRFSSSLHVPPYALLVAAGVPAIIVIGSKFSTNALFKIIAFGTLGIYIGFQMVVLAALRARLKGWVPSGKYTLGAWGLPVNIAALAYGVLAMVNMAWPRTPDVAWYDNWIVLLSAAVVIGVGVVYMAVHPAADRSEAPYDDAIPKAKV